MIKHTTVGTSVVDEALGGDFRDVGVFNRSDVADVYVRLDGNDPEVEGDDSYVVPPGVRRVIADTTSGATVVRLIATAADTKVELEA